MFKYIIAASVLSALALAQDSSNLDYAVLDVDAYHPDSASWTQNEGFDQFRLSYCKTDCDRYCENCTEPNTCDPLTEKKCDTLPVDPDMHHCRGDDVCVPMTCQCDYLDDNGNPCERICTVECTEEQIKCEVEQTATGCLQNDVCIHKGFSNDGITLCDGFCPVECEDDELFCPNPNLPNGCKVAEDCVPKQKDHQSNICPQQQCPLECSETHHLCVGPVDVWGCKEDDECVIKQTSIPGEPCPGTCPVTCKDSEVLCDGQIDYSDTELEGCKGQDVCHQKVKDDQGVYCPPDSASHLCPKACPPHEVLCEPYEGPLGCKGPYECYTRSVSDNDEYCPSTSDCPCQCAQSEYCCPRGNDENGCKLQEQCIAKERGFDGELCPLHCPELCTEEQVYCPGGIDETGCRGPSSCRDKTEHKWGEAFDEAAANGEDAPICPGYCPTVCESHEILCPSQLDPCNGCPTEEVCREAIKDKDGLFCAGKEVNGEDKTDTSLRRGGYLSFSHNCPKLCREQEGEVLCPVYEDETGCKPEAQCVQRVTGTDGEWCSSHSACPKECPKGYKLCIYGDVTDENGCVIEPNCVFKGKNDNDLWCPGHCPPICSGGQELVSPGYDADGCALPSVCEASTDA